MLNWSVSVVVLLIIGSVGVELVPMKRTQTVKRVVYVRSQVPAVLEFTVSRSIGFHPMHLELYDMTSKKIEPCTLQMKEPNQFIFSFTRPTRMNEEFRGTLWYTNRANSTEKRSVSFYYQVAHPRAQILISIVVDSEESTADDSDDDESGDVMNSQDLRGLTCSDDCNEVDPIAANKFYDEVVDMAIAMGSIAKPRLLLSGVKHMPFVKSLGAVDLIRQCIRCELELPHLSYQIQQGTYIRKDELLFEMTTMRATIEVLVKAKKLGTDSKIKIVATDEDFFNVSIFQRVQV